jgi:hypothetical protein
LSARELLVAVEQLALISIVELDRLAQREDKFGAILGVP